MLDPGDRISGKGARKLRKARIETVLFPHALAMEVKEWNRLLSGFNYEETSVELFRSAAEENAPALAGRGSEEGGYSVQPVVGCGLANCRCDLLVIFSVQFSGDGR
jgi:hypothetical protein